MGEVLTRAGEVAIGRVEQIPPGEGRTFAIGSRSIAVFRTRADELFATQANCPHRDGPLADGMLGGRVIVCPLHERSYDLESGQEIGGECRIAVYPVRKAADGMLYLNLTAER